MSLYTFMFSSSTLDQPWFIDSVSGRTFTGAEVKQRTDALAQGLLGRLRATPTSSTSNARQDSRIRDVIAIVCPNSVEFGPVVWACHKLGSTVASINGGCTSEEMKYQFLMSGTRTIFAHIDTLDRVIRAAEECHIPPSCIVVITDTVGLELSPEFQALGIVTVDALIRLGETEQSPSSSTTADDADSSPIAFLCWSSGTTGLPKAVIISHSAVIANIVQMKGASVPSGRASPGDKALAVIPLSHMFGLLCLVHLCPYIGVATVVFKSMPTFHIFLEIIVRLRIGHLFLAPPLVGAFVKHPATANYDLTFLQSALIAAAPLDGDMETAFQKIGGPEFVVTQGFGMTECSGLITGLPLGTSSCPGSVGRLLSSTEAKIVDERGTILPPGHRGQLCVRGPQLCLGYLDNARATKEAFDADGFLITGDIAEVTPDGYFHIVDRLKLMIKNKGYQISPAELEAHLLSLELVDDAGVVGRPDPRCGEVPVAFVVLSALGRTRALHDLDSVKDDIKRSVQDAKSDYKWLHDVYFVNALPRLPSGKIIAKRLKEMLRGKKFVAGGGDDGEGGGRAKGIKIWMDAKVGIMCTA